MKMNANNEVKNKEYYCVELSEEQITKLSDVDNLLLNLMAGLDIYDLTEDEIKLLAEKFGQDWKNALGYE